MVSQQSANLLHQLAALGVYGTDPSDVAARFVDQALQQLVDVPPVELFGCDRTLAPIGASVPRESALGKQITRAIEREKLREHKSKGQKRKAAKRLAEKARRRCSR